MIILPFYFLFITSIPVGVYTITLWKDIPFALLVVFWAFWFVKLRFEKKEGVALPKRNGHSVPFVMAMGLFRYNGVVYFVDSRPVLPSWESFLPERSSSLPFAYCWSRQFL